MTAKEVFQGKKELRAQLSAVTHSDWFSEACAFAEAQMFGEAPTLDALKGARRFKEILFEMTDEPEVQLEGVSSGLKFPEESDPNKKPPEPNPS